MVICSPDVDQEIVATSKFVAMIRDVGGQIRVFAVLLLDHPIFLIAKHRGPKPERTVLLQQEPARLQFI